MHGDTHGTGRSRHVLWGLRPEYALSPVVSQYLSTVPLHGCAHHEEMGIVRIEDVAFTVV